MEDWTCELELPGFRFHPTEEELLSFYLRSVIFGRNVDIIGFLNIYNHDPKELPGLARIGEREWYFFVQRDRRQGSGGRPNRVTEKGYWKATGSDRNILSVSNPKKMLGFRKTLVFYRGRAPHGAKTDWVMNEYRLPDSGSYRWVDVVVCKIYRKATSLKEWEHRAAAAVGEESKASFSEEAGRSAASLVEDLAELQMLDGDMDWDQESFCLSGHTSAPLFLP